LLTRPPFLPDPCFDENTLNKDFGTYKKNVVVEKIHKKMISKIYILK
jgi:hypothetical protein